MTSRVSLRNHPMDFRASVESIAMPSSSLVAALLGQGRSGAGGDRADSRELGPILHSEPGNFLLADGTVVNEMVTRPLSCQGPR